MAQVAVEMTANEARLFSALERVVGKVGDMEKGFRAVKRESDATSRSVTEGMGGKAAASIGSLVSGFLSVGAAIGAATKAHATWLANLRESSAEAEKASRQLVTLAALQEGGKKAEAVQRAAALAARHGMTDRGQAFDVVQSIQSATGGDLTKALSVAGEVFAASRLGIAMPTGQEVVAQAFAQGMDPGELLRRSFAAGELSQRTPEDVARFIPGLAFFRDKELGLAAGTVMSGQFGRETETYVKALGTALGPSASEGFVKSMGVMGIDPKADELTKLRGLRGAGITSVNQLSEMGLSEIRQLAAMANVLQNLPQVEQFRSEIPQRAKPGLFTAKAAAIEEEIPQVRTTRDIDTLRAMSKDFQGLQSSGAARGPIAALEETRRDLAIGLALREMGIETTGFGTVDALDEEGRPNLGMRARLWASRQVSEADLGFRRLTGQSDSSQMDRPPLLWELVNRKADEILGRLDEATRSLGEAAREFRGGPTMVPAGVDR
ncbi:MAG: hypothetical protein AABZ12_08375 [Planctomycetota bacterium]